MLIKVFTFATMIQTPSGKIRKITLGVSPKDAMAFETKKPAGHTEYVISQILEDKNSFHLFGKTRFLVYIKKLGVEGEWLWKSFIDVSISIEYEFPNGDDVNIV